jgi:hypothetical protein
MAKILFSSTSTLNQFINTSNDLSNKVGDLTSLNTTIDSDIVGAINELKSNVDSIGTNLDTNILDAITVSNTAGKSGSIVYDNTTGQITYTGPDSLSATGAINVSSTNVITVDNATTVSKGVASFDENTFETFLGDVSLKDSGVANAKLQANSITFGKFRAPVSLIIYDSSNVAIKTLYSPGA